MAWNTTLVLRQSSDGAVKPGQTVQLYAGDGTGALIGTYTDNGDGSYTLSISTSVTGTIKINGVAQVEKTSIGFLGDDLITHLLQSDQAGTQVASSIHGLLAGEGAFVGTAKTQTLTNKTIAATNTIGAVTWTAGVVTAAALAGSIPDSKLNQLTTAEKVKGVAVETALTASGLSGGTASTGGTGTGLKVLLGAATPGSETLKADSSGIYVKAGPGLEESTSGLTINPATMPLLSTPGTVDPASMAMSWTSPHFFGSSDDIDRAISKLDKAVYAINLDVGDALNSRLLGLSNFTVDATYNDDTAAISAIPDAALYHKAAATKRIKKDVLFIKTPLLDRVLVMAEIKNTTAAHTTSLLCRILNSAGSLQGTLTVTKTHNDTSWLPVYIVFNVGSLASGFYHVEISLQGEASPHFGWARNIEVVMANTTYVSITDPVYWGNYEDAVD